VSRPEPRAPSARSPNLEDLEELGDDAIIAQQTEAHLPQKRIVVADEERSVVIAEQPAPRPLRSYRVERGEPTLVIRDRNALDAFRRKLAEKRRHHKSKRHAPYVWAGLALAAFAMGGLLTLVLMRNESPNAVETELGSQVAAPAKRVDQVASEPAPRAAAPVREAAPPQVKLEELPVERSRRR